jgi:hypothetical protein
MPTNPLFWMLVTAVLLAAGVSIGWWIGYVICDRKWRGTHMPVREWHHVYSGGETYTVMHHSTEPVDFSK